MFMSEPEIKILPNPKAVTEEAAERIIALAGQKSAGNGITFSLMLSGGSTPKALYELLASDPWRPRVDWPNMEIFFGDERCVPPDHPDSNFKMADEALLSRVPIVKSNIHRIRGELAPEAAAIEYGQMLKERFGDEGPDMILLGMGDDGHTASLFPGSAALKETHHRCVANFAPRLNVWRITTTAPFINRGHQIMVLVTGAGKAKRVAEVLEGPRDPERLPIQLINPVSGRMQWLMDAEAAGMHEE
jgi:6-phosphogluconolactonase